MAELISLDKNTKSQTLHKYSLLLLNRILGPREINLYFRSCLQVDVVMQRFEHFKKYRWVKKLN